MTTRRTFLDILNKCDNFHLAHSLLESTGVANHHCSPFDAEKPNLYAFALNSSQNSPIVGLLRPSVVEQLVLEIDRSKAKGEKPVWYIHPRRSTGKPVIGFAYWLGEDAEGERARSAAMKDMCERWRDARIFEGVIGASKWRDELYPVHIDPFGPRRDQELETEGEINRNYAFEMERAATSLFGVVTYGVHMTIYQEVGNQLKVWVPTRARTKQTWGGYLDNSVAGGIPSGMPPFEALVKESMEEASIAEEIVRVHAKAVGSISYYTRTPSGWLQPEVEYVYDLPVPPGADPTPFTPKPLDGEVESFEVTPDCVP
ncbi:hypothetical protein HWV62_41489 [Athelia sp. TMB]|nr:hypothetical protein HWV62_41489 [Athelia sp. TMB]